MTDQQITLVKFHLQRLNKFVGDRTKEYVKTFEGMSPEDAFYSEDMSYTWAGLSLSAIENVINNEHASN
jgi:hypothetical protein